MRLLIDQAGAPGADRLRTQSMSPARIVDAIAAAAVELVEGRVTYEQALADYFADLLRHAAATRRRSGRSTTSTPTTSGAAKKFN